MPVRRRSRRSTLTTRETTSRPMARKPKKPRQVRTLTHEEASRKNIPTAEYQSVMAKDKQNPIEAAYRRRNRDLDPQIV